MQIFGSHPNPINWNACSHLKTTLTCYHFNFRDGKRISFFRHISCIHWRLYRSDRRRCRPPRLLHQPQRRRQRHRICCSGHKCSRYQSPSLAYFTGLFSPVLSWIYNKSGFTIYSVFYTVYIFYLYFIFYTV